jgi:hypothetical protein
VFFFVGTYVEFEAVVWPVKHPQILVSVDLEACLC